MKIPERNAFTLHPNGATGVFFPFGAQFRQADEITHMHLFPQRVIDVCDVIEQYARAQLVLFCVHQYSRLDPVTQTELPLVELARTAGIVFTPIDDEAIVLPTRELRPLLATFGHYDLTLFDVDDDWQADMIARQTALYNDDEGPVTPLGLPMLETSRLFLESHDDMFVGIESYDPGLAQEMFGKTLRYYAGSVVFKQQGSMPEVAAVPRSMLERLWAGSAGLTILNGGTSQRGASLRIGVSRQPYDFRKPLGYEPDLWIMYDLEAGEWRFDR